MAAYQSRCVGEKPDFDTDTRALELARRVSIESVVRDRGLRLKRQGREMVGPCLRCGGTDRFAINIKKQVFNCRGCRVGGDTISLVRHITGCGVRDAVAELIGTALPKIDLRPPRSPQSRAAPQDDEHAERLEVARWLWRKRRPLAGSLGERYIRARGYTGPLPATLGFLPSSAKYPDPAVIAAFGLASEVDFIEHGRGWETERVLPLAVTAPDDPNAVPWAGGPWPPHGALHIAKTNVVGVHLVKLLTDGSDRRRDIKDAKITIGVDFVAPIVLAPPNDLLALTIGEGIEKVLADHAVSGAGAWAATSAIRLPDLAALVPRYIEYVTILVDDNETGRTNSAELAGKLDDRGIAVRMTSTGAPS
jgi:hypothetical protein